MGSFAAVNLLGNRLAHARTRPLPPALIEGDRVLDYEALVSLVVRHASYLAAAGIRSGDVVGPKCRPR